MEQYDDSFDFGFTAVTEEELQEISPRVKEVTKAASKDAVKLNKLYDAIQPLLNNLLGDADKDYIYWPDRERKVNAFKSHINGIMND